MCSTSQCRRTMPRGTQGAPSGYQYAQRLPLRALCPMVAQHLAGSADQSKARRASTSTMGLGDGASRRHDLRRRWRRALGLPVRAECKRRQEPAGRPISPVQRRPVIRNPAGIDRRAHERRVRHPGRTGARHPRPGRARRRERRPPVLHLGTRAHAGRRHHSIAPRGARILRRACDSS